MFWATYPVMMADIYGLNNLGTNLGFVFVVGGALCGYMQTFGGEWYAKTIEDLDITCFGAPCFRQMFVINQSFISMSFVLFITLRQRIPEKRDVRRKGVQDVRYFDELAETDFMTSRAAKLHLFQEKQIEDIWMDDQLMYKTEHAEQVLKKKMKTKEEESDSTQMDTMQTTAEWTDESSVHSLVYGGDIAKHVFREKERSGEEASDSEDSEPDEGELHHLEQDLDMRLESSSEDASGVVLLKGYLEYV